MDVVGRTVEKSSLMKKTFAAIILVFLCKSLGAAPDLSEAANDVCNCLKAPYTQITKAMELVSRAQASGDMSALVSAQGEMMGVINASNQCFNSLTEKYPEIAQSKNLQEQVMSIADQQCPRPGPEISAAR